MVKKVLCILCFIFIFNYGKSQPLGFSLVNNKKRVSIPFEVNNNLIIVPVIINGKLPLKFILDTGVRTTILTEKYLSDNLNLSYPRKYTIAVPGGSKLIDAYVTNNVSVDLPGIHGQGLAMLVLKEDYLQLCNYLGMEVHGILGYELFSRFVVKINYKKKILTIMQPEEFKPSKKYKKIPIQIEDTKPYITGTIVQTPGTEIIAKLLVDTGASHALMLESGSDKRIKIPTSYISSSIGRGLGGVISGKIGRVKSLKIGMFNVKIPVTSFPDPNSYVDSLKMSKTSHNGSIGGELLNRFTLVFDFANEKIYLNKNSEFNKPFHYNLSGITVKAIGPKLNVYEIVDVRKESVGDKAGVMPGDYILSINSMPATNFKLREVNGFFNDKPNKIIELELLREGERIKKKFRLKDQI